MLNIIPISAFQDNYIWLIENGSQAAVVDPGDAAPVIAAFRKFATGIYLVWYPIKSQPAADGFLGEVLAAGVTKALTVEVKIPAPEGKLDRAALLVLNPPYGFAAAMSAIGGIIAGPMAAQVSVTWIAGSE